VKPTHADVGAEVTAEISTGPYRFVYRKRFHKKPETELTVLAPRREQLTGDEAHERVRAMLAETLDTELWHAQRVLQAASTAAVQLSGCNALSRALDAAAGDATALSGGEPLLVERIDAEYARYFTPTGRPTLEWADAIAALSSADDEVAACAAAVAAVDERVQRHATLTGELAELSRRQQAADARHGKAAAAAEKVAELTEQLREAKLIAAAATATSDKSTAAHAERARLRTEIDTRTVAVAALEVEAGEAAEAESMAREVAKAAEAAQIAARLAKIDAIAQQRDQICGELSAITLTGDMLQRAERATAAVERAEGKLGLLSATVEFTAITDTELTIGDHRVSLPKGHSWSTPVSAATEIEIPGVLTARFSPGTTALDIQAELTAAQQELAATLQAGQVSDVEAARSTDQRRRELENRRDQLTATLAGLCGDDDVEQL
ncbi:MAG: AAA family ATPase, partial [Mycobacterium sp.]